MSGALKGPQPAKEACERRLRPLAASGPLPGVDCEISWHGPAALDGDRPGSEACIQALCGLMQVNGRDAGAPRRLGLEVASVAAGILAAHGVIAAEIAKCRGRPVLMVRTSVLQAGLVLLSHYFVVATGLGDAVPGPPLPAPGPPFCSADGHWFEIETLDAEPWQVFWTSLGAGDADLGRGWTIFRWRYERATCSLPRGLHEAASRFPLARLSEVAADAQVSLTPLRAYPDVLADPGTAVAHPPIRSLYGGSPLAHGIRRGVPAELSPAAGGLPLSGIRVVEATSRIQGPFAGMLLRMLGAEVVRVQPPEGDYGRAALSLHRDKETVRLDLGSAAGRSHLVDLVADADVFLHNWRPGKATEWDLDFGHLAPRHPRLVYANTSGWGDRPEGRRLVGTDFLLQAFVGLGEGLNPEGEPAFPSRVILSDLFGALVGAEGVLAGLYRREQDGSGTEVRSSLLAGAMSLQAHVLDDMAQGKEKTRRRGRPLWGTLDRPVPTEEGRLMVSVEDDAAFERLCRVCDVSAAGGSRESTEEKLADRLGRGTAAGWEESLLAAGVPCAVVVEDLAAVPADPRFSALFEPVGIGGLAPRTPWSFE